MDRHKGKPRAAGTHWKLWTFQLKFILVKTKWNIRQHFWMINESRMDPGISFRVCFCSHGSLWCRVGLFALFYLYFLSVFCACLQERLNRIWTCRPRCFLYSWQHCSVCCSPFVRPPPTCRFSTSPSSCRCLIAPSFMAATRHSSAWREYQPICSWFAQLLLLFWHVCVFSFPSCHFGKLYGLVMALSAVFSLLQYPCFALVKGVLGGDPLYVSTFLNSSSCLYLISESSPNHTLHVSAGEHRSDSALPAGLHPSPFCLPALSKQEKSPQQLLLKSVNWVTTDTGTLIVSSFVLLFYNPVLSFDLWESGLYKITNSALMCQRRCTKLHAFILQAFTALCCCGGVTSFSLVFSRCTLVWFKTHKSSASWGYSSSTPWIC